MKQKLVELAGKKGFKSKALRTYNLDDELYYLWLCELQKWLRDEHEIWVHNKKETKRWSVYVDDFYGRHLLTEYIFIDTYEKALERGLIEALNLLS